MDPMKANSLKELRAKPSALKTYGPIVGLIGLALAVGYWTFMGGSGDADETTAVDADATVVDDSAEGVTETTEPVEGEWAESELDIDPGLPITYQQAEAAGTVDDYEWLGNCDFERGRVAIYTNYAPPCVAAPEGVVNNTSQGVTEDTIKIVVYRPSPFDLAAFLDGANDPSDLTDPTVDTYMKMYEDLYQTWGRKIEWIPFKGTGTDDINARADAQKVADEIGAFASIGGPSLSSAYADELLAQGVVCIVCGVAVSDEVYREAAPYYWGYGQTPEQFLAHLTAYISQRLLGRNAVHAGDPVLQETERKFGVVYFDSDPPQFAQVRAKIEAQANEAGWPVGGIETYVLDPGTMANRSREILGRMKADGVTTVIFIGDLLMPQFLTKEATAQDYYPEWIISGTVFTDTSFAGRLYDQAQWANAFGISSFGVPVGQTSEEAWALYNWYTGEDPPSTKNNTRIFRDTHMLAKGIHLAGPNLTAETFEQGLFNYGTAGGTPTAPQISFGNNGLFDGADYLGLDDVVEIWWDATAEGLNEQGIPGVGLMRYSNGGQRYNIGEMPSSEPDVFDPATAVTGFDGVPEAEALPDYPSPAGG